MSKQLIGVLVAGLLAGVTGAVILTPDEVEEGQIRISQLTFRPRYFEGQARDGGTLARVQVEACGEEKKRDGGFQNARCTTYIADAGSPEEILGAASLSMLEVKNAIRAVKE